MLLLGLKPNPVWRRRSGNTCKTIFIFASLDAAAHGLKGGLLNLGLNDAAALARQIELAAKRREQAQYGEWLDELKKQIGSLCRL
jgi:HPt (histidine-containing phosphotransfer) domain-containing protein